MKWSQKISKIFMKEMLKTGFKDSFKKLKPTK